MDKEYDTGDVTGEVPAATGPSTGPDASDVAGLDPDATTVMGESPATLRQPPVDPTEQFQFAVASSPPPPLLLPPPPPPPPPRALGDWAPRPFAAPGQPAPSAGWVPPRPDIPFEGTPGSWAPSAPPQPTGWNPPPGAGYQSPSAGWSPEAPAWPGGFGGPSGPAGPGGPGGPGGFGGPGGPNDWAPAGPGSWASQPGLVTDDRAPGQSKSKHLRNLVLVGTAVVLLAGAGAAGVALGRSSANQKTSSSPTVTIPGPGRSVPTGTARINVAAVTAKIEPGVVDITSVLGTSGEAAGTGMILTSNGEVLTNNHVVNGGTKITARIDGSGRTYQVRVLGVDPTKDVSLVQMIGASNLKTVALGNSSAVRVGDQVVAIGNALALPGPPTVTSGIVSALNRSIVASDAGSSLSEHLSGLLQTSASINPGNSGGPLINTAGQVIGMNTAAASGSSSQTATNIGFAIPINEALSIAQQIQQGKASSTVIIGQRGFIGVQVITVAQAQSSSTGLFGNSFPTPAVASGAYVAAVVPQDPAQTAGLAEGDVITAVDGSHIGSPTQLGTDLQKHQPGQVVSITWVDPGGASHSASITLVGGPPV